MIDKLVSLDNTEQKTTEAAFYQIERAQLIVEEGFSGWYTFTKPLTDSYGIKLRKVFAFYLNDWSKGGK